MAVGVIVLFLHTVHCSTYSIVLFLHNTSGSWNYCTVPMYGTHSKYCTVLFLHKTSTYSLQKSQCVHQHPLPTILLTSVFQHWKNNTLFIIYSFRSRRRENPIPFEGIKSKPWIFICYAYLWKAYTKSGPCKDIFVGLLATSLPTLWDTVLEEGYSPLISWLVSGGVSVHR